MGIAALILVGIAFIRVVASLQTWVLGLLTVIIAVVLGIIAVTRKQPLADTYFGEGITVLKDRIYQLTWKSNVAFVYDKDFRKIREFQYAGEG